MKLTGGGFLAQPLEELFPRQVVQIAKEDPRVFDSYDRFWEAMVGPP